VERGQKNPSLESLGAIARGFGMDIADLFTPGTARDAYPALGTDAMTMVREAKESLERVLLAGKRRGRTPRR
jgi:transcriptional regulator with XRE-family HTH domain